MNYLTRKNEPNISKKESDYINFLRVILIIGVVFTHSAINVPMPHDYSNITYNIVFFQQEVLGEFRVPTFFLLSGYFFFKKENTYFNLSIYKTKIKKKINSLLIPYIIWCLIALIFKLLFLFITENLLFFDFLSLIKSFIFYNGSIIHPFPINGPLWYIRDLIIICIISPMIFYIIKHIRNNYLLLILLIFFIALPFLKIPLSLLMTGIVWFSIGSILSINKKSLLYIIPMSNHIYYIYFILVCANIFSRGYILHNFFMQLTVISGVLFILKLTQLFYNKCNIRKCNSGSIVMFIYCSHFIVDYIKSIYTNIFSHQHLVLTHILIGISTLFVCIVAYLILDKYLHRILNFIIGNR